MANLSASRTLPHKGETKPWKYGLVGYTDIGAASVAYYVYKSQPVMLDVSDVDGYGQPFTDAITGAADDVFLGLALEQAYVSSSDLSDGTVSCLVARGGIWGFPTSLAVTDIGAPIYMSDSATITTDADTSGNIWIGTLVDVDSTYDWVDISDAAGRVNAAT